MIRCYLYDREKTAKADVTTFAPKQPKSSAGSEELFSAKVVF